MRPKILIADDADIGRSILRALLRKDFDVIEARNGLEAIQALESSGGSIAAAILDVMMPVMDGFRVLKFMREKELIGHIPAIMLTAISDTDAKVRCYEAGATDIVEKPYDEKLLIHKIRALVQVFSTSAEGSNADADARAYLEDLLDTLPDAVYVTDPGTHAITYANAAFRDLPGMPDDPVGADILSILPPDAARAVNAVWEDLLIHRVRSVRHFRIPGDPRLLRVTYNALVDDAGGISDLIGCFSDATPYILAAPGLEQTLLAAQEKGN